MALSGLRGLLGYEASEARPGRDDSPGKFGLRAEGLGFWVLGVNCSAFFGFFWCFLGSLLEIVLFFERDGGLKRVL